MVMQVGADIMFDACFL